MFFFRHLSSTISLEELKRNALYQDAFNTEQITPLWTSSFDKAMSGLELQNLFCKRLRDHFTDLDIGEQKTIEDSVSLLKCTDRHQRDFLIKFQKPGQDLTDENVDQLICHAQNFVADNLSIGHLKLMLTNGRSCFLGYLERRNESMSVKITENSVELYDS